MGEAKSEDVDEEMKDDIDCVRDLLDRLKDGKEKDLQDENTSSSKQENGRSSEVKQNDLIAELQKKTTSVTMNLKPVQQRADSPNKMDTSSPQDDSAESSDKEGPQKRKQDQFLVEVQERAEVISKSARKAPESLVSSIGTTLEEDPDTEKFLKAIRTAPSSKSGLNTKESEITVQRRKSASDIDFSIVVSNCSVLNVEPQKSRIPLVREGSLKGRRKPTPSIRRRSLKQGVGEDWDDDDKISEAEESMEEEGTESLASKKSLVIKNPPLLSASSGLRPRTKPKSRVKSMTVSGIALPGLSEVLNKKKLVIPVSPNLQRSQGSAAEIVRAAAEGKRNLAAKEEKVDKEPEKPAWLVEAETRRKLHEKRRQVKTKPASEDDGGVPKPQNVVLRSIPKPEPVTTKSDADDGAAKPLNVVLHPVSRPEAVAGKNDENDKASEPKTVFLRSATKSEPVTSKVEENDTGIKSSTHAFLRHVSRPEPVTSGPEDKTIKSPTAFLRPVSRPEPVSSGHEDDETTIKSSTHAFLRPVSRPEPVSSGHEDDDRTIISPTVFLRPVVRPDPVTTRHQDSPGRSQPVRLKPLVRASDLKSSVSDTEATPTTTRALSETTTNPDSPTVKPIKETLSYTVTPLSVDEKVEAPDRSSRSVAAMPSLTSPEYHRRTVTPVASEKPKITSEKPKSSRQETTTTERSPATSRVTVSSNYVSAPPKVAPKTRPKATVKSKTVTVTASEVPEVSTARRTSAEFIHAKVERNSPARPASTIVTATQATTRSESRASWRGSDFRPTYTGEVLPQWKLDLMEKKKSGFARGETSKVPDRSQSSFTSNVVVIPQWKKDLADRRKQRGGDVSVVQTTSNKENQPKKTSPEVPQWKRDFVERRKRRDNSPGREQPENADRSTETPEWQQRLSSARRIQTNVIPRSQPDESADPVPSFMKEFEKKKKRLPRGGHTSYV